VHHAQQGVISQWNVGVNVVVVVCHTGTSAKQGWHGYHGYHESGTRSAVISNYIRDRKIGQAASQRFLRSRHRGTVAGLGTHSNLLQYGLPLLVGSLPDTNEKILVDNHSK
jgi:hypothetical protein